jgi:hypothetical protein
MRRVQFPECCGLTMVRHLNTSYLAQWATSCLSTSQNSAATIQGRHTMLPSLMILYVTAYLQHQAVARLTSTGVPWAHLLQDLMIPAGKEIVHQERHNGTASRRPPILLRPIRLRILVAPYPQWSTPNWRSLMRVHVAGYHGGLDGAISQWHRMTQILDMAHKSNQIHTLLSAMVVLPGGHLSKYHWETELLRRLKEHRRFLSSLCPRRRASVSSASSESSESSV